MPAVRVLRYAVKLYTACVAVTLKFFTVMGSFPRNRARSEGAAARHHVRRLYRPAGILSPPLTLSGPPFLVKDAFRLGAMYPRSHAHIMPYAASPSSPYAQCHARAPSD
jgi:hypothetical protein